jgi:OHCU decarboxylase
VSGVARLDALPPAEAEAALQACCGSRAWVSAVASGRPYGDAAALYAAAESSWWALEPDDWLEAFRAHPRIGERKAQAAQDARASDWAAGEQSGMDAAGDSVRDALAEGNRAYEARFGYIYIVCATGREPGEMLEMLRARLHNDAHTEIRVAAEEQRKITRLRLDKLLADLGGVSR